MLISIPDGHVYRLGVSFHRNTSSQNLGLGTNMKKDEKAGEGGVVETGGEIVTVTVCAI